MYVLDATPLIYLGKAHRLDIFDIIAEPCVVPKRVYGEVVRNGIEAGYPDARRVGQAVDRGWLETTEAPDSSLLSTLQQGAELTEADAAVLALAHDRDAIAVMDEQYGRNIAAAEEVETRGTAYLILRCVREETLSASTATEVIDTMVDEGWYCSPSLYQQITAKIDELESSDDTQ